MGKRYRRKITVLPVIAKENARADIWYDISYFFLFLVKKSTGYLLAGENQ
jgi:hypothetical protein